MLLSELVKEINGVLEVTGEAEISDLAMDSRKVSEGALFFCVSGANYDGHQFAASAVEKGACALIVEKKLPLSVPQVLVQNSRKVMPHLANRFFGYPAEKLRMLGITGTKGKTTTSYMVKAIMEKAGFPCGLIGTTGNMIGDRYLKSEFTTPEPIDLFRTLRQMADEGVNAVSMEVSAHALAMHRLDGIVYEAGCYTNLSQDHLDMFHTMEDYFACKKSFFSSKWLKNAAVNADEPTSQQILQDIDTPCMTYGICINADVFAREIEITENGVSFILKIANATEYPVHLKLTGMFNVYNALAAASVGLIAGIEPEKVIEGLESVRAVPGRAEVLETRTPYKVILDYSHSPEALKNILTTVREFARGKIIALFGCGGDRDKTKRSVMGKIGGEYADYCILTSDNPRSENPFDILQAVEEGIRQTHCEYIVVESRRNAIRHALNIAKDGDIVILAGKGHETYQEIMGVKYPFNEKTVVQDLLREMEGE